MIINKPKFWNNRIHPITIFLFPLSIIYILIIYLKKKFSKIKKFNIPIICIGNIYVGGTGKTPISIFLANELNKFGKKPVILRKYYKSHLDEYRLIRDNYKNLIVNKNRIDGLHEAEKSNNDIVILDDGLQDYQIKKDLNLICFNSNQLVGNGLVLPAGPLREKLTALKEADIVIINGNKNSKFEEKILNINRNIEIFYSLYKPINIDKFKNKKLFAIAAIGNPENFFKILDNNNLLVKKRRIYPDHYTFSKNEIRKIFEEAKKENFELIMTEKDYFKIKDFGINNINYLQVELEIKNKDRLIDKIIKLNDKNN
tara:strand:+ start:53 stop:994 length:942 start_codon:yes stop_codon:yes gene_type:complete